MLVRCCRCSIQEIFLQLAWNSAELLTRMVVDCMAHICLGLASTCCTGMLYCKSFFTTKCTRYKLTQLQISTLTPIHPYPAWSAPGPMYNCHVGLTGDELQVFIWNRVTVSTLLTDSSLTH